MRWTLALFLLACLPEKNEPRSDTGPTGAAETATESDPAEDTDSAEGSDSAEDSAVDPDTGCAPLTFYADADADGYGSAADSASACEPPDGYVTNDLDCDDAAPDVHPDAEDPCGEGVDADCDGAPEADCDGDGFDREDAGGTDRDDTRAEVGGVWSAADAAASVATEDSDDPLPMGVKLAVVPDMTGDGLPEVLSGERGVGDASDPWWSVGWAAIWDSPGAAGSSARLAAYRATEFGEAVAGLQDLDEDGLGDAAVGGPLEWVCYGWWCPETWEEGAVTLLGGAASGELSELATIGEDVLGAAMYTGYALAKAPDLDGDGHEELVSETWYDVSYRTFEGAAETLDLLSPGAALRGATDAVWLASWALPDPSDALIGLGDRDGDGVHEVAVAVRGSAWILPSDAASGALADLAETTLTPSGGGVGALADLGDVDGDGLAELAASVEGWTSGGETVGAVLVLPGGIDGALDEAGLATVTGANVWDALLTPVSGPGDLDGDGAADLVSAGQRGDAQGAYVWSGPLSGTSTTDDAWIFVESGDRAVGAFVDEPVDADGDGANDLIFSALAAEAYDLTTCGDGCTVPADFTAGTLYLFLGR